MIEKLSSLGNVTEIALLIFIAGFLARDQFVRVLEKLGFKRTGKKPERPEGERRKDPIVDDTAQIRARTEQLARLVKEMHPIICDETGALPTLLRMHEAYLPASVSAQEQMTGNKEPAWHNYTVIEQQKALLAALFDFTAMTERLTAEVAKQTQAVLVAIDSMTRELKSFRANSD